MFLDTTGQLVGMQDYFTHKRNHGLDLHDNKQPDFNETGTYSTHLFARKAGEIVKQHAANQANKVGLT